MPENPILLFPAATVSARAGLPSFIPPKPSRPTHGRQRQRLANKFTALQQRFGDIQTDIGGVDPEQVIVFETVGSLADFQSVVKRIAGMEWLGDFDTDITDPDPGFLTDGSDASHLPGRLFVVISNRTAYAELLKLWREWTRAHDEKLPRGYGKLAEVFKHLQDLRPWGPKDRIATTGVVAYWEKGLSANQPNIRFEAELWCRTDAASRDGAYGRLRTVVNEVGGQCVKQAAIPDIDYHGVLLEVPAQAVRQTVEALAAGSDTKLLRLTDVKYFAPMGQASIAPVPDGTPLSPVDRPLPVADPVAAILDGLPLTNHASLHGRLLIDDPNDFAAQYQVGEHRHGTAMASLVVHGELDANQAALDSRVYVRPVMYPGPADMNNYRWEVFPPDELPVDLIHRAVRRIFEGDGDEPPQAPSIKVINLSLGDASQLFDRVVSPWARLLDWLADKYKVLFVVSGGNHLDDLSLPTPPASVAALSDEDLRGHTLRAMAHQRVQRRLLSPAESVNSLTVGALHAQAGPVGVLGSLVDLLRTAQLPSPISTVASGFRRSVKPEILVPGGQRHYMPRIQPNGSTTAEFTITNATAQPGQLVAAPGGTAVPPSHATRISGTSNAVALTTRRAVQFVRRIEELREEPGGDMLTDTRLAVILKAMLVHGASWGDWQDFINEVFDGPDDGPERWWRIKRACAQFLGYGLADFDRGTLCTGQRVIILGCSELDAEQAHVYQVPLPPALNATTVRRRVAVTLAWLTPINTRHRNYAAADLWFDPPETYLQVKRTDVDHTSVKRGTIQHEVLEGDAAVPITENDTMPIQVNCRADAGNGLVAPVPYALIVSLETAQPLGVSIYDQVKVALDRIRDAARVRPTVRAARQ